jgi:LysM repeat protein
MTDQAQSAARQDLVALYAGRLHARHRLPAGCSEPRIAGRKVQTFGREPLPDHTGLSRGKQAGVALMASAIVAGISPSIASAASYNVQPGDTLSEIAEQHGVPMNELIELNDLDNPDYIMAGQELVLEESATDPVYDESAYQVRPGDSLSSIAAAHNVSLASLIAINDIENPNLIYIGQMLTIPSGSKDIAPAAPIETDVTDDADTSEIVTDSGDQQVADDDDVRSLHLVRRGETLSSIAARYDVSVDALASFNGIADPNVLSAGTLLKIPAASYQHEAPSVEVETAAQTVMLDGIVPLQQSLSLSCESAAVSIATNYWGYGVSEWVFIENMPYSPNPHYGFRGDMNGPFGGTNDYGVYPEPLSRILANYGYIGQPFYTGGNVDQLKSWLDNDVPVLVWMTANASVQTPVIETHEGESFVLVPEQHAVVAAGYDDAGIYVADPGNGQLRHFNWDDFVRSWSYFDGMSLAVYPKT